MPRRSLALSTLLMVVGLIVGAGQPASSEEQRFAELTYLAYYGGLEAVEIDARVTISNGRYELSTVGKSSGFLDYLFPFTSRSTGTGSLNRKAEARDFFIVSTFRGKSREIKGISNPGKPPVWSVTPPIPTDERDPVPEALRTEALDPVTALISAACNSRRNNRPR